MEIAAPGDSGLIPILLIANTPPTDLTPSSDVTGTRKSGRFRVAGPETFFYFRVRYGYPESNPNLFFRVRVEVIAIFLILLIQVYE